MKNNINRKAMVIGVLVLLIGVNIVSGLSIDEKKDNFSNNIAYSSKVEDIDSSLTIFVFDESGKRHHEVVLSGDDGDVFYDLFDDLKYGLTYSPNSFETESLKVDLVDFLEGKDFLPSGVSREYFISLINPSPDSSSSLSLLPSGVSGDRGFTFFCNFVTFGEGGQFPIIILPRLIPILLIPIPRIFLHWNADRGITSCGGLLSGKGFIASGKQTGTALGFWGIGFSVFLPPVRQYGFIGYALFATATAENLEPWPPNEPPVVSAVSPLDGDAYVPLSTNELRFRISDSNGDRMRYTVTTDPDVGSGSGNNKKEGVYSIPINGLEEFTKYSWTVKVTDGVDDVEKRFNFFTEKTPFDPFNEGWIYRKKITIDHNKVAGDLVGFPVLVSIVDSDLLNKAQGDGDDILFMDRSGFANQLFHEIEYFDKSSGELVAWVNVPIVTDNEDTFFYMYYGNPDCGNQQVIEGSWYNNYLAVYHMNDESNGILDSTAYNRHSTNYEGDPTFQQTGISGYAIDFDGDDDEFHLPHNFNLGSSDITLEVWMKATSWPGYGDDSCIALTFTGEHYLTCGNYRNKYGDDDLRGFSYSVGEYSSWNNLVVKNNPPINSWIYIVGAYDNNVGAEAFYNSVSKATDSSNGVLTPRSLTNRIGVNFDGLIDEIRVSKIKRTDDWIETTYNSINDPSSFFNIGPEETSP